VIDERADANVVEQQDIVSCGIACGEMLLKDREIYDANQSLIATETGAPVSAEVLAAALNRFDSSGARIWLGGTVSIPGATDSEIIDVLISTGSWGAVLWEPLANLGHIVVVAGMDETGKILIRDPWDATSYKMDREEFRNYWNSQAIYSLRQ